MRKGVNRLFVKIYFVFFSFNTIYIYRENIRSEIKNYFIFYLTINIIETHTLRYATYALAVHWT